ncbi:MAG: hypothetical protein NTY38_10280, partial [Acidobacteria bacterium]|nr:hypothetical protein [Acidobacteriota bacterium]
MTGSRRFALSGCLLLAAFAAHGADLEGTIVVKRKLTKSRVTADAGLYQRGVAVSLDDAGDSRDALAFERGHVAIYVDGEVAPAPQTVVMEPKNRRFTPDLLVIP